MMLTGAQILMKCLSEQGVDVVFGYPGGAVLNIYDELYKNTDTITHYITAHEQGASHAADGYARATGKTGVVIATSGPGATNLVTGIATAYLDSTPMVAITGNVATPLIGRDSFQEVDICGITMPITKHNYFIKDVTELAPTIRKAFAVANSGRKGPVLIDIPKDIQTFLCEYTPYNPEQENFSDSDVCKYQIKRAVDLIANCKRPYIYAGGGVVSADAQDLLSLFADKIDAPVGVTFMGITAMSSQNPHFLGLMGMHGKYASTKALYESDLIITIGARFSDRATGDKEEFSSNKHIIHIDIDPAEINKNIQTSTFITSDITSALQSLLSSVPQLNHDEWNSHIDTLKDCQENKNDMSTDYLTPQQVITSIDQAMDDKTVIATDVGQHQMWVAQYYGFTSPRTFLTSGGLGTMGFGMGSAIGGCIGTQSKTVLFTSDGSFHMNLNELATAVSYNLPLVIVVLNNNALGMVRQWQTIFFDKRYSNTTLNRKTDYVKLAYAFGADGIKVTDTNELNLAIEKAKSCTSPLLIECIIDSDERVLPMIPPGKGIRDIILN